MKKIITFAIAVLPTVVLAATPDQCTLNSTCSFSVHGKFNKQFITSGLKAGQAYVCNIIRGKGELLSVQNVYTSKGVTYDLKGRRLDKPFVIHGAKKRTGYIKYTLYNHNDPWRTNSFQFKCQPTR